MKTRIFNILAVYDICDERRLSKVAKALKNYGERVQKSVFELHITITLLKALHSKLNSVIDIESDSVRYYLICVEDWQKREVIGKAEFVDEDWDKEYKIV